MAKSNFSLMMVVAMCMYFATTILSLGIPAASLLLDSRGIYHAQKKPFCVHTLLHPFGIGSCVVGPRNSETVGVSADLLHQFELMAQYSAAAYCAGNNNGSGDAITCQAGNCPLVEAAGAHSALEFENTLWTDDTGFLAIDDTNRLVVLAFRGSESLSNWKVNIQVLRVQTDLCRDCHVHQGFWDAWTEVRHRVKSKVLHAVQDHPAYRLVVTGHSLGGALAALAAAELRKHNDDLARRTELFTFGSPRVGNAHTAAFLTDQSDRSYRLTSMSDPIPRQPLHSWGYVHMSPEYWIRAHPEHPGPGDIEVVKGFYNTHGNSGKHGFKIGRHGQYFGPVSRCAPAMDFSP